MNFQHYDLRQRHADEIVQVNLSGTAANVQLMGNPNSSSYRAGQQYRYTSGHSTRSPVRLQIPHSWHWHVAIDLGGYAGTVMSSENVLHGPHRLPSIQESPLSSVPSLVQNASPSGGADEPVKDFDVFISRASEDKDQVVRPLAHTLQNSGLKVWYDDFELRIGDSLRREIDMGGARSRFGVVVLSRSFFGKGWPYYELDGLVTRLVGGAQIILPIWHDITKVVDYGPLPADKLARSTGTHTIDEIAQEIVDVIKGGG